MPPTYYSRHRERILERQHRAWADAPEKRAAIVIKSAVKRRKSGKTAQEERLRRIQMSPALKTLHQLRENNYRAENPELVAQWAKNRRGRYAAGGKDKINADKRRRRATDPEWRAKSNVYAREYHRQQMEAESPEQKEIRLALQRARYAATPITPAQKKANKKAAARCRERYATDPEHRERIRAWKRNYYRRVEGPKRKAKKAGK